MAIADAIRAGIQLRSYIREAPQRAEEAKLKSQLYKAQAEHQTAQAQLITNQLTRQQALLGELGGVEVTSGALPALGDQPQSYIRAPRQTPLTQPAPLAPQPPTTAPIQAPQAAPEPTLQTPNELMMLKFAQQYQRQGFFKEANDLINAATNAANSRRLLQDQRTQQEVGKVEEERQFLQNHGLLTPQRDQQLRSRQAALLHAGGKTNEAIKLLQGETTALAPGAELTRTYPGEQTEVLRTNPNRPVVVSEGATAYQPTPGGGPAVPITPQASGGVRTQRDLNIKVYGTPEPPPGKPQATQKDVARVTKQGGYQADLSPEPETFPAEQLAQVEAQLIAAGMAPPMARYVAPFVLRGMTPTTDEPGAAPTPATPSPQSPAAQVAGQRSEATRLQTAIPRETAEQIGVPIGTTYGDLESGRVQAESPIPRQMPTAGEREDLSKMEVTISSAQKLLVDMKAHPEYTGLLGNFLTDPQGALKRALARRGGNATKEERKFLAQLGVTTATLRSQLIGLAQTQRELSGLVDFLPGPETSAEQIEAALEAIVEHVTLQRDKLTQTQRSLGVQTPGGRQGQTPQPQGNAPAGAPPAAQKPLTEMSTEELFRELGKAR